MTPKIHAEKYTTAGQFSLVKICIDNEMYIAGIKVRESIKNPGKLWIQMPSYRIGGNWKRYIEFAPNSSLQKTIEDQISLQLSSLILKEKSYVDQKTGETIVTDLDDQTPIDLSGISI